MTSILLSARERITITGLLLGLECTSDQRRAVRALLEAMQVRDAADDLAIASLTSSSASGVKAGAWTSRELQSFPLPDDAVALLRKLLSGSLPGAQGVILIDVLDRLPKADPAPAPSDRSA
jgi:hypothetical protein